MPSPKTIFETCRPRADVEAGTTKDEQFAADLAQVIRGTAPPEYSEPQVFFAHTYPTRGLRDLFKAVCKRISGQGGEVASVLRLHTQYGGGKTHSLIGLTHAVQGMQGVENAEEFVEAALLPNGPVRVASIDGENTDPANGVTLEKGLRAYSLWGDLAYQLAGREGYERVQESDRKHVALGAETVRELFGDQPTLVMLDEVSVYLRKVEATHPGKSDQFTAFLQALIKAVESSPQAALVMTLAIGKDLEAQDAYRDEHERAVQALAEAETVASRKSTQLNPTEEDETADVLRRRLFEKVDLSSVEEIIAGYGDIWSANRDVLPESALAPEVKEQFRRGYPLHPETLEVLTEKTSSLSTFQRTRGMLRLLARTVHVLWRDKPQDAFAIHPHHIDLAFSPIREEVTVRLQQGDYAPALKADVAAVEGDEPSVAQFLDQKHHPGGIPITSYIARTIFLNTLAYGDAARGINAEQLKFSVCSPTIEPSFIEQARLRFVEEATYLDDRPGAPLRFNVEPNLRQILRKQMAEIDSGEVRAVLNERIRQVFGSSESPFSPVFFPPGPYEVPDEVGDGRPFLVLMGYEALTVPVEPTRLPAEIEDIVQYKGAEEKLREFRNNLVFVVADQRAVENMKNQVRRRLALFELRKAERIRELADHQQRQVNEWFQKSSFDIALAILHCYRHLFYPSHMPMPGTELPVAHTSIEVSNASENPGEGQIHVVRILRGQKKLINKGDQPDAAPYVRDQTPLKTKGELSTFALRNEFRKAPKLSILLADAPLIDCIREGIEAEVFIYRESEQVWGKGDPSPSIQISENAFVHTLADAKKKHLWPRAEPLSVELKPKPETIEPGGTAQLTLAVTGGTPPYHFKSSVPDLSVEQTEQRVARTEVSPAESATYQVEVSDSRGQKETSTVQILVAKAGQTPEPPQPPEPPVPPKPPPPAELSAEGPLRQALGELWEKARKNKHKRIDKLIVRFFDPSATWKVHQAMATLQAADIHCNLEAEIEGDGIDSFAVNFEGQLEKANAVKSFLDPQLRQADEHDFRADYTLTFPSGLALDDDGPETLAKNMTRYGAGEAYVEAHAAPPEEQ